MKRLRSLIILTAIVMSFVACSFAIALWIWSFDRAETLTWDRSRRHYELTSERGGIIYGTKPYGLDYSPIQHNPDRGRHVWFDEGSWETSVGWFAPQPGLLGFYSRSGDYEPLMNGMGGRVLPAEHYDFWRIPYWFPVVITGLPAALFLGRLILRRAAKRSPAGCCPTCGYDLRASKHRCPECGTTIGQKSN